jgi:hypothetical protein
MVLVLKNICIVTDLLKALLGDRLLGMFYCMRHTTVLLKRLCYAMRSCDIPHEKTEETRFSTTNVDNSLLGSRQQTNGLPG